MDVTFEIFQCVSDLRQIMGRYVLVFQNVFYLFDG